MTGLSGSPFAFLSTEVITIIMRSALRPYPITDFAHIGFIDYDDHLHFRQVCRAWRDVIESDVEIRSALYCPDILHLGVAMDSFPGSSFDIHLEHVTTPIIDRIFQNVPEVKLRSLYLGLSNCDRRMGTDLFNQFIMADLPDLEVLHVSAEQSNFFLHKQDLLLRGEAVPKLTHLCLHKLSATIIADKTNIRVLELISDGKTVGAGVTLDKLFALLAATPRLERLAIDRGIVPEEQPLLFTPMPEREGLDEVDESDIIQLPYLELIYVKDWSADAHQLISHLGIPDSTVINLTLAQPTQVERTSLYSKLLNMLEGRLNGQSLNLCALLDSESPAWRLATQGPHQSQVTIFMSQPTDYLSDYGRSLYQAEPTQTAVAGFFELLHPVLQLTVMHTLEIGGANQDEGLTTACLKSLFNVVAGITELVIHDEDGYLLECIHAAASQMQTGFLPRLEKLKIFAPCFDSTACNSLEDTLRCNSRQLERLTFQGPDIKMDPADKDRLRQRANEVRMVALSFNYYAWCL
jgi:hypothetical protein